MDQQQADEAKGHKEEERRGREGKDGVSRTRAKKGERKREEKTSQALRRREGNNEKQAERKNEERS